MRVVDDEAQQTANSRLYQHKRYQIETGRKNNITQRLARYVEQHDFTHLLRIRSMSGILCVFFLFQTKF